MHNNIRVVVEIDGQQVERNYDSTQREVYDGIIEEMIDVLLKAKDNKF